MRQFLGMFLAFAIGAMSCQIYNDQRIASLKVEIDSAYHEGWRASFKPRAKELAAPRHEEDEPGWNCHTMGNHVCGPKITLKDARDLADILTKR